MITIKIKEDYAENNPVIAANPNAFILHLGDDDFPIPSISRNYQSIEQAVRTGSPFQINLRPGEEFLIENEVFQTLVNSSKSGADASLINRVLYYINAGVLEVQQDGTGTPLTAKQVYEYEAP